MENDFEGKSFNSFEEFESALKTYCENHCIVLCVNKSKTVEAANKKLANGAIQYAKKFRYRCVRYKCKRGGERLTKVLCSLIIRIKY